MGIDAGRAATTEEQQRATHQQAGAGPEAEVVAGSQGTEQQRAGELAQGVAGSVKRHQATAPLLHRQLVDPALAEDEHHRQGHAYQQAQHHPDGIALHQRQQGHRQGTHQQA
ncbi:hypothetical protein D9M70_512960 [compost metagenome]